MQLAARTYTIFLIGDVMLGCIVLASKGSEVKRFLEELFLGDEYILHDKVKPVLNPGFTSVPSFGSIVLSANVTPIPIMPIPQRSSMIFSCVEGSLVSDVELEKFDEQYDDITYIPAKLLAYLNKNKTSSTPKPYKMLIKERIHDKLSGTYACCLAYLSNNTRSNIALLCNGTNIHVSILTSKNFDVLLWTTNSSLLERVKEFDLNIHNLNTVSMFGDGLEFNPSMSLVVHPLYITHKWNSWKLGGGKEKQVQSLIGWLQRQAVK